MWYPYLLHLGENVRDLIPTQPPATVTQGGVYPVSETTVEELLRSFLWFRELQLQRKCRSELFVDHRVRLWVVSSREQLGNCLFCPGRVSGVGTVCVAIARVRPLLLSQP